jgi:hypothetical protein
MDIPGLGLALTHCIARPDPEHHNEMMGEINEQLDCPAVQ